MAWCGATGTRWVRTNSNYSRCVMLLLIALALRAFLGVSPIGTGRRGVRCVSFLEQQCQEAYHRTILKTKIPGMFKGSTEHVIQAAMPQLVKMDGLLLPSEINFTVR